MASLRVVQLALTVALILGASKPASAVIITHERASFTRFNEARAEVTPTRATFWMRLPHPDPVWKWGATSEDVDEYDFQATLSLHGNQYCFCIAILHVPNAPLKTGSLADLISAADAGLYELNPTKPGEEWDMLDGYTFSVSAWPSDTDRGVVMVDSSALSEARSSVREFYGVKIDATNRTIVNRLWELKPQTVEFMWTGSRLDQGSETVSIDYAVPMRGL